jgi:succinate-acetate transporter protein
LPLCGDWLLIKAIIALSRARKFATAKFFCGSAAWRWDDMFGISAFKSFGFSAKIIRERKEVTRKWEKQGEKLRNYRKLINFGVATEELENYAKKIMDT